MILRRMEEKDMQQVVDIENATFSDPWSFNSFQSEAKRDTNIYIVAELDGLVIGYCGLWGIAGEGQITNVAVKEEYRKKGIGKEMLSELLKLGREQGLNAFTLEVREHNVQAIHLYQSLGFQSVGIRKDFYNHPKENAIIMWL